MKAKNLNEIYGTLSETLNELLKLGYTHDFNIKEECIVCDKSNISLSPEEFKIDQVYRFEGDSDPEYQAVLYAISSEKFNLKGTLVNGYGLSAEDVYKRQERDTLRGISGESITPCNNIKNSGTISFTSSVTNT